MSDSKTVDPALRFGDVGERWGNLAAPAGAFSVGDPFLFQGEEGGARVVRRVLGFPGDPGKRLVHYESALR